MVATPERQELLYAHVAVRTHFVVDPRVGLEQVVDDQ
jgi:hypothetical protein